MKIKLAAVALFASVAMMCSTSNADLLSRMLGRGGCGNSGACCGTPSHGAAHGCKLAQNIGKSGGLFRPDHSGSGCGLMCGSASGCGQVVGGSHGLLSDGGGIIAECGQSADSVLAEAEAGYCRPVPGGVSCGGEAGGCGGGAGGCGCGGKKLGGGLLARLGNVGCGDRLGNCKLGSRLGGCGCGGGDAAPADCGCDAAPMVEAPAVESCGCDAAAPVVESCGCDAAPIVAAPAVESCGCETAAPAVESCGCGGPSIGSGNLKSRAGGLLNRIRPSNLNLRGGSCGCDAAPVVESCGCEAAAPVVESCGCEAAPAPVMAEPCGCEAAPVMSAPVMAAPCGCDAAPAVESCGCGSAGPASGLLSGGSGLGKGSCNLGSGGGLLARLRGGASAGGCGCEAAAAPVVESCGCGGPSIGQGNLKSRATGLVSRVRPSNLNLRGGSCGCEAAAPVVESCGCGGPSIGNGALKSRATGLVSRVRPSAGCGCDSQGDCGGAVAAPAPECKLTFWDRLRGDRTPRGPGCSSNNGCNPPCPHEGGGVPVEAAPCGCESGPVYAEAPVESCSSCNGGAVDYGTPYETSQYGTPVYETGTTVAPATTAASVAPVATPAVEAAPVAPVAPAATEGNIIVPKGEGASYKSKRSPIVNPAAFVIGK